MKKHFVEFLSPGTLFSESSVLEIPAWDVMTACKMARSVKERHGATPYGFRFITKERGDGDLDSKVVERSCMYFLGGKVRTIEEVFADNLPNEEVLRFNMKVNRYDRVIENNNSWLITLPLRENDVVLKWNEEEQ